MLLLKSARHARTRGGRKNQVNGEETQLSHRQQILAAGCITVYIKCTRRLCCMCHFNLSLFNTINSTARSKGTHLLFSVCVVPPCDFKTVGYWCFSMSNFKVKTHQIRFPLRLRQKPRWESSDLLAVFKINGIKGEKRKERCGRNGAKIGKRKEER